MHYVRHVQDKMYLPPLRLTVFFAPLRFLFSLFSLFCRNISQTGNYVCTQKIFFPRGMLVTTKGKRGTGREAQAGFFSLPLVPLFLSPSFSRGGEGRKALSRWSVHGRQPPLLSPFFSSFLLHLLSSLLLWCNCDAPASQLVGDVLFRSGRSYPTCLSHSLPSLPPSTSPLPATLCLSNTFFPRC